MSPLLVLSLLFLLHTTHSQSNYYGNGYPGYPQNTGDIATPPDYLWCTPTFTVPTPQLLQSIGVRYEYNYDFADVYHIVMGLYGVNDSSGSSVHTLVAAANQGNPTPFSGDGPANEHIQLEVGNFTYMNENEFSGLLQPGSYYAGCFNTDQLCPILWQNPAAGPQPNGGSDPAISYPFSQSLPLQVATVDEMNGGEFVYVVTINVTAGDGSSSSSSGVAVPTDLSGSPSVGLGPSSVVGDPQFVGLLGQSYQVHGIDGAVYNLISDKQVQVNARFTFLDHGECLRGTDGSPLFTCWSHPGSYLSELAVRTAAGDSVVVVAGAAEHGFVSVTVNGVTMSVGEMTSLHRAVPNLDALSISYSGVRSVTIANAGLYTLVVENSDGFVNLLRLEVTSVRELRETVQSHGLLGQTWRRHHNGKDVRAVEGYVDDYVVSDGGMLGCDFVYKKFDCK